MKTRLHSSNSPTITPATIPWAPRCGKSYHLLLNFKKLSRKAFKDPSVATAVEGHLKNNKSSKEAIKQHHIYDSIKC